MIDDELPPPPPPPAPPPPPPEVVFVAVGGTMTVVLVMMIEVDWPMSDVDKVGVGGEVTGPFGAEVVPDGVTGEVADTVGDGGEDGPVGGLDGVELVPDLELGLVEDREVVIGVDECEGEVGVLEGFEVGVVLFDVGLVVGPLEVVVVAAAALSPHPGGKWIKFKSLTQSTGSSKPSTSGILGRGIRGEGPAVAGEHPSRGSSPSNVIHNSGSNCLLSLMLSIDVSLESKRE